MHEIEHFYCEVGAARSGTHFLGNMLAAHPMLAYSRRPKYIWRHGNAWKPDDCLRPEDATTRIKGYIRRRFCEYMKQQGKDRLLVCTQANVVALDFVNEVFPDGKIIHIIRDGREVAASQRMLWQQKHLVKTRRLIKKRLPEIPITDWPAYVGEYLGELWRRLSGAKYRLAFGPKIKNWRELSAKMDRLEFCALNWRECVSAARSVGQSLPKDRYHEVRFEDLLTRAEETVHRLLEFMELPPSKEIDRYIKDRLDRNKAGHWLDRLSEEELDRIVPHMADLLKELGYI